MKVLALLCGLLASAFVWALPFIPADMLPASLEPFLASLYPAFLGLWPDSNSQQFVGVLAWHGLIATGILGGLLAVLTPATGTLVLLAGAAGWAFVGMTLPTGFNLQVLVPMGLTGLAAFFSFIAAIIGGVRRRAARRPPSLEEMQREDALRMEPAVELRRSAELQGIQALRESEAADAEAALERDRRTTPDFAAADADEETPEPMPGYEPRLSGDPDDREQPLIERIIERRGNPLLAALNAILLLLLCVAVGVLLYSEYRSGGLSAAFGLPRPPGTALSVATAAPESPGPAEPAPAGIAEPVATEPAGPAPAEPEVKISTSPLDLADLSTTTWDNPFEYCAAIGSIDGPDKRYAGPNVVPAIVAAGPAGSLTPRWRCLGGTVRVCSSSNAAECERTPSAAQMTAYCAANPDAKDLAAPAGTWSCRGTRPEIPLGQVWPIDAEGFLPAAWTEVPPPASADAPAG